MYRWRTPVYQQAVIADLAAMWDGSIRRVLDVGGGTGIIAQVIKEMFPVDSVTSIDVERRFLESLTVDTATYDGQHVPFADGSFDCVLLINVLHHVPVAGRATIIRECRRVTNGGPLYIKDHTSTGRIDDLRLLALDALGNLPFGGMVKARYLTRAEWGELAADGAYDTLAQPERSYRSGVMASLFPNRLETSMQWTSRSDG